MTHRHLSKHLEELEAQRRKAEKHDPVSLRDGDPHVRHPKSYFYENDDSIDTSECKDGVAYDDSVRLRRAEYLEPSLGCYDREEQETTQGQANMSGDYEVPEYDDFTAFTRVPGDKMTFDGKDDADEETREYLDRNIQDGIALPADPSDDSPPLTPRHRFADDPQDGDIEQSHYALSEEEEETETGARTREETLHEFQDEAGLDYGDVDMMKDDDEGMDAEENR